MIFFKEDWEHYPGAVADTSTVNQSFIEYSALLKSMGVKNYLFPLQLHNPELIGVDPFSPNLTFEQQLAIAFECKTNFFYYIREISRAPGGDAEDPIRFKANRGNMALFWLFFNHITSILIQIRQTGKSFSTDTLMFYLLNIRCRKTEINLLTKDDTLRASNLARLKNIDLELPYYLRARTRIDVGNGEVISVKKHDNIYRGHLPNMSPKLAERVGRGLTSPIFQIDEAAFFFNIAISLPAALAAGGAARDRARNRGEPYGTILTTTAGKKDDRDGAYVFRMLQYSAVWNEAFFDSKDEEDLRLVVGNNAPADPTKREKNVRVNCTFNHRQLGYTDEWLRRKIQEAESEGDAADRDFGNVWTSGSISSPLSTQVMEQIRLSESSTVFQERQTPHTYFVRWQIPEKDVVSYMKSNTTVMTLDTSEAQGGDDIGMVLRSTIDGTVIAAGNYNETNLIAFARWVCAFLVKHTKITLVVERRSTGAMLLDYLLLLLPEYGIDPCRRLFNWVVQNADEKPELFKSINSKYGPPNQGVLTSIKKNFGFATSASGVTSRKGLYGGLKASAGLTGSGVRDKTLIDQILALEMIDERIDHPQGGRDDMCIAWLLGYWFLTQGKNLDYYGINPRTVLARNDTIIVEKDPIQQYNRIQQESIKKEIESYISRLKAERDEHMSWRLENRIKQLSTELNENERTVLAVDDLIASIRDNRQASARISMQPSIPQYSNRSYAQQSGFYRY